MRLFRHVPYNRRTELGNGVSFTFHDAGHILGSAYVVIEWPDEGRRRKLLFTADVGRYGSPILRDPDALAGPVDQVITESTYGGAKHAPMDQVGPQLLDAVRWVIQARGRLLVPAFAVNVIPEGGKKLVGHFGKGFELGEPAFDGLAVERDGKVAPMLSEAHAWIDCRVAGRFDAGDHVLVLGRVVGGRLLHPEAKPTTHIRKSGAHY